MGEGLPRALRADGILVRALENPWLPRIAFFQGWTVIARSGGTHSFRGPRVPAWKADEAKIFFSFSIPRARAICERWAEAIGNTTQIKSNQIKSNQIKTRSRAVDGRQRSPGRLSAFRGYGFFAMKRLRAQAARLAPPSSARRLRVHPHRPQIRGRDSLHSGPRRVVS